VIPVRITIHLAARLFRVPLLRLDGHITLVDDEPRQLRTTEGIRATRRDLPVGRLLALAEADLAAAGNGRAGGLSAVP
jgi:hypothetical protein